MRNIKAFSLLEMALVMVIIGVLLSGGITLFNIFYKKSKISQAEELVDSVYESLIASASRSLCLDVPSDANEKAANLLPPNIQQRQDPFLKYIRYFYAPELNGSDPAKCSKNNTINNICGRKYVNFAIEICKDESCSSKEVVDNVAFVIISGGWNKNVQVDYPVNIDVDRGTTVTVQGLRIHFNYANNKDGYFYSSQPYDDPNRPEEFDDIVKYVKLEQLQAKIQCENAKLKITTDNLPPAHQNMDYTATIDADGGIPFITGGKYKWSVQNTTLPAEFSLSPSSGNQADKFLITKTSSTCPGNYSIQVGVEDSDGNKVSKTFSLVVLPDTLKANPDKLTLNPVVGKSFSQNIPLNLSGGKSPYTCSINTNTSYNGLTFSYNDTTKTASISGTPTDAGSYTFGLICSDNCPSQSKQTVNPQFTVMVTCDQLKVLPDRGVWYAVVGSSFSVNIPINISGGKSPYTCNPQNTSCNGLNFSCNSSQATISGTPTSADTCNFICRCNDSCTGSVQTVDTVYTVISSTSAGGGGGGGGGGGVTPATCSFNYSPIPVPLNTQANVSVSINNGPTNVTFSPTSGTCTSFSNVNSVSCRTANLSQNLSIIAQLSSGNNCSPQTLGKICVARPQYRVWNTTGTRRDFRTPNGSCRTVNNNSEITQTNNRLTSNSNPIRGYTTNNGTCGGSEIGHLDYSWATCIDDDGDLLVNFNADGSASDR